MSEKTRQNSATSSGSSELTCYTVFDCFSGIGGMTYGLELTGKFKTIAFCEKEPWARKILKKNFPGIPIFKDIKRVEKINADIFTAGFPCQPFSHAAHGNNIAIDLWPEFMRVVWLNMPKMVIAENVQKKPILQAQKDLQLLGYRCEIKCIGAHDCGADHIRNRWWAYAHTDHKSKLFSTIDAKVAKLPELCKGVWGPANYARTIRVSDGIPNRMDRLKLLGNSLIPYIPMAIGLAV